MGEKGRRGLLFALLLGALPACGGGVDLGAVPRARAGCEEPTPAQLEPTARMLPGRVCQECHRPGGQARDAWTASGTVYEDRGAACNGGGVVDARVELIGMDGKVQVSMMTNSAGNFYTAQPLQFPLRVRVSKGDRAEEMVSTMGITSCATCHQQPVQGGAPGRIYLK
jgi:mono/diheme cytochrome c family protein